MVKATQRYGGYGGHLGVDLSSSDKGIAESIQSRQ